MASGSGTLPIATRAAVTVGVDKTGGMTPLRAAASGARDMADWLKGEGYAVTCLTDETQAVTVRMLKDAVTACLAPGSLERLIIYFAGHGYLNGTSEIWLLSGAPSDPDEAVDLNFSAELARSCGVRSVVFISDACRSTPPSLRAGRVQGSSIFPNEQGSEVDVEVDRFFAARPGDPALELEVEEARTTYAGLFTETLRRMHRDPDRTLTRALQFEGRTVVVVPSRRLKERLPERVNEAAQERSIRLKQIPQLRLECGEDGFVARAIFTQSAGFAADRVQKQGATPHVECVRPAAPRPDPDSQARYERILAADWVGSLAATTSVTVRGAEVLRTACPDFAVTPEEAGPGGPAAGTTRLQVAALGAPDSPPGRAGSLLVEFENGSGTVVAVLPGYVASILVEEGRVVNVSYVPAGEGLHWIPYWFASDAVARLRARTAVAARSGLLAADRDEARRFHDEVRQRAEAEGRLDPTLGLYAAVACADVGLRQQMRWMGDAMRREIEADLFDVALLARPLESPAIQDTHPVVPFCPMLSQTWSFLRASGATLPAFLVEAARDRRPALWTTFGPTAIGPLIHAMEKGELR